MKIEIDKELAYDIIKELIETEGTLFCDNVGGIIMLNLYDTEGNLTNTYYLNYWGG